MCSQDHDLFFNIDLFRVFSSITSKDLTIRAPMLVQIPIILVGHSFVCVHLTTHTSMCELHIVTVCYLNSLSQCYRGCYGYLSIYSSIASVFEVQ